MSVSYVVRINSWDRRVEELERYARPDEAAARFRARTHRGCPNGATMALVTYYATAELLNVVAVRPLPSPIRLPFSERLMDRLRRAVATAEKQQAERFPDVPLLTAGAS